MSSATTELDLHQIPPAYREGLGRYGRLLAELAGDNLLALTAFGGWRVKDPFFDGEPARSVAVLDHVDLVMLDKLAGHGAELGRLNVAAPLVMTPDYIAASADVFPVELLEIRQTGACVLGKDYFADLQIERRHLRLQCEREFKSGLIQLRQGLLAAAGKRHALRELCLSAVARTLTLLRGLLVAGAVEQPPARAAEIVEHAARSCRLELTMLADLVAEPRDVSFEDFARFYDEIDRLARYADSLEV